MGRKAPARAWVTSPAGTSGAERPWPKLEAQPGADSSSPSGTDSREEPELSSGSFPARARPPPGPLHLPAFLARPLAESRPSNGFFGFQVGANKALIDCGEGRASLRAASSPPRPARDLPGRAGAEGERLAREYAGLWGSKPSGRGRLCSLSVRSLGCPPQVVPLKPTVWGT